MINAVFELRDNEHDVGAADSADTRLVALGLPNPPWI
jgi:hypothetical protein